MRLRTGYLDRSTADVDEALGWIEQSCRDKAPISVGLLGNAAELLPELFARGHGLRATNQVADALGAELGF